MFENSDDTRPEGFSERRHLADTHDGRCEALKDCFAHLHERVMTADFTESNGLRAIQIMEKLHRTISLPPVAPEASDTNTQQIQEDDPYAYDHTNMHRILAEMSDDDMLSHVEGLVGAVEHKHADRAAQPRFPPRPRSSAFSGLGQTVPAPAKARRRRRT